MASKISSDSRVPRGVFGCGGGDVDNNNNNDDDDDDNIEEVDAVIGSDLDSI